MGKDIRINTTEEESLLKALETRNDAEALRIKRYLSMLDLSRTATSPLFEIVEKVKAMPLLKDFDNVIIPEIVPADISFDLFNFAPDHPARSTSDTYYVDSKIFCARMIQSCGITTSHCLKCRRK